MRNKICLLVLFMRSAVTYAFAGEMKFANGGSVVSSHFRRYFIFSSDVEKKATEVEKLFHRPYQNISEGNLSYTNWDSVGTLNVAKKIHLGYTFGRLGINVKRLGREFIIIAGTAVVVRVFCNP